MPAPPRGHSLFPLMDDDWEPTRATLHAYAQCAAAVPRALAIPHPRWWHVGLRVRPNGLVTEAMALPGGGAFDIRMDLRTSETVLETSRGDTTSIPMGDGLTATELAERLLSGVAHLGIGARYDRGRFESEAPRAYDPAAAGNFFEALVNIVRVFEEHRAGLDGETGPPHLWPHGFDVAFEWFGTRTHTDDGEEQAAQLNLGWYPAGRPYFYSNPWPFDSELLGHELPHGAQWHTEGWKGSLLYYDAIAGDLEAPRKLREYAAAVYRLAAPRLTA